MGLLTLLENHDEDGNHDSFEERSVGQETGVLMVAKLDFVHQPWGVVLREFS